MTIVQSNTNTEIKEFCKILRLNQICGEFEAIGKDTVSHEDYLHQLLKAEVDARSSRSCEGRIKRARFPYRKYLNDLEIQYLPIAMQRELPHLSSLDFIREGRNLLMTGNSGTGKTHCGIGLGIKACEEGFSVLYITIPLLITEMKEASSHKQLLTYERKFKKYDLVVADELGYASFDRAGADLLFNMLSQRIGVKSTIITSNLSFVRWNDVFCDPVLTSALVDRLTYKAILVNMEGESYRLRETLRDNGLSMKDLQAAPELHNRSDHE